MRLERLTEPDYKMAPWTGGETAELYIYPPGTSYQKRDFLFRLSTAAITAAESVFTPLPGVRRVLMMLEGEVVLSNNGGVPTTLRPFEQCSFSGDRETVCFGTGRDFNLMLRESCEGAIWGVTPDSDFRTVLQNKAGLALLYVLSGTCRLQCADTVTAGEKGTLLIIAWEHGDQSISQFSATAEEGSAGALAIIAC